MPYLHGETYDGMMKPVMSGFMASSENTGDDEMLLIDTKKENEIAFNLAKLKQDLKN